MPGDLLLGGFLICLITSVLVCVFAPQMAYDVLLLIMRGVTFIEVRALQHLRWSTPVLWVTGFVYDTAFEMLKAISDLHNGKRGD